ncbi:DUF4833 domain-containing protein [Desertivirga arenae]|uniref:DUF4833 domain-containing protein n=1 Tax=Desertivirga arenae TaxID=2810309 RepID=UPI001A9681F1|nr:DUF4833 domain-containing protein [Pedobacter sp. SYSU D00823]
MLILLIVNFLVRSGRLNKAILVVKNAYKRRGVRLARTALLLMLLLIAPNSFSNNSKTIFSYKSDSDKFPVPRGVNNMLFYLQRDPDANTVVYQLNIKDGQVDAEDPVNVFWIKFADKGQVKELTSIQRRLAYGLRSKSIGNGNHELRFAAYPKLPLYLLKEGHEYNVHANVGQRELVLNKVFVRVKEGSICLPKVDYVDLTGVDVKTGRSLTHRIDI